MPSTRRFFDGDPRAEMRRGFVACLPVALAAATYGTVLGVLAAGKGLSLGDLLWMSFLVLAGAAQFVAVDMWGRDLPVGAMIVAAFIVNLRYALICGSLHPVYDGLPLWQKMVAVQLVVDENWAVAMAARARGEAGVTPGFILGGGFALIGLWQLGGIVGYVVGGGLPAPERFGLDFAFTAAFLALALGTWRGKREILPWLAAAAVAVIAERLLPGKWYILAGSVAGAGCAALTWRPESGSAAA